MSKIRNIQCRAVPLGEKVIAVDWRQQKHRSRHTECNIGE